MIPEGKYLATISDKAIGTTKKGDPQLVIGFTIDEGEQRHVEIWPRCGGLPN